MGESSLKAATEPSTQDKVWVAAVRAAALPVFFGLITFCFLAQPLAGRVVWTVAIASLPLLIVLAGYHRWRRICPLAWFAQLPAKLGWPGSRRASPWLQQNYYYVAFGIFFFCLWLRLVAINGDGMALGTFLIAIALVALVTGALFTGKTWCNYACPVMFVEKIYTEPRGIRQTPNSQCDKCTACKPACPDINEENGYWKEVLSGPKRAVYFAFPGVVLAFYFYYYLQAGTWSYYFSGVWTDEPQVLRTAFLPGVDARTAGFFFFPAIPRAIAALLTLASGAVLSLSALSGVESLLRRRKQRLDEEVDDAALRHVMLTVAGFAAFVSFYSFAGAPTLRLLPAVPHVFQVLAVGTATLFLVLRYTRRQRAFVEETVARQIIRRWEWVDMKPPSDLREAFLIHTIRSQTHARGYARLLEIYKDAVRESMASGFINRAEVQRLESLRDQLQISTADHQKIMADLDDEEKARLGEALDISAEKRLQVHAYVRALHEYLEEVARSGAAPDEGFLRHLRLEYGVTPEEHGLLMDQLLARGQGMAPHVQRAFETIEGALRAQSMLGDHMTPAAEFLADALARRCLRAADGLLRGFGCSPDIDPYRGMRDGLIGSEVVREEAVQALGETVSTSTAARLLEARRQAAEMVGVRQTLAEALRPFLENADPFVRVAALYVLHERGALDDDTLTGIIRDEHEVVRETAICLLLRSKGLEDAEETGLVTIERMFALRAVPLFFSLAPEDLASLAAASREKQFTPGEALCVEGERGDELFVLLSGEVEIRKGTGANMAVLGHEQAGGFIGEMAVLDPGPRAATVVAGSEGTRVLRLSGATFREVLRGNPSVVSEIIRILAARVRGAPAKPQAEVVGAPK